LVGRSVDLCAVLVLTLLAATACGESRPAKFWTVEEAESIKSVRGAKLNTTVCTGLGESRSSAYRRFSCTGTTTAASHPELPVRVRYVLNPRGDYRGPRSAYLATEVFFDSFGVP
jgi:hypothetical protein